MSVAPMDGEEVEEGEVAVEKSGSEALMILGVDREVGPELIDKLKSEEGILEIGAVAL